MIEVSLPQPLHEARFLRRPNRFVVHAAMDGDEVICHLPDPGRMRELLRPEARLWLRHHDNPRRKTSWSVVLVEAPDRGDLVSVVTTLPNRLVGKALEEGALEELTGWHLAGREVTRGRSRFDFLLAADEGRELLLEVKSVSLIEGGEALFPDAVTARGARHLRELAELATVPATEAVVLFVVQREGARQVRAAAEIDPEFAAALDEARDAGVEVLARSCRIERRRVVLGRPLPVVG